MPSGASVPPVASALPLCPVPHLGQPHHPWPGTEPERGPGSSSSLPILTWSAWTASFTQTFPKAQGALPSAPDCALTSSSLIVPLQWGFRSSCQMDRRKEAPDWLMEKKVVFEMGLSLSFNFNLAPTELAEVSFLGQTDIQTDFQEKPLASLALKSSDCSLFLLSQGFLPE